MREQKAQNKFKIYAFCGLASVIVFFIIGFTVKDTNTLIVSALVLTFLSTIFFIMTWKSAKRVNLI